MIIAGTGHRPDKLVLNSKYAYTNKLNNALVTLIEPHLDPERTESVISGMALGFDTALAIAAIRKGIPLTAAVPFAEYSRKWPKDARARFHSILSKAQKVVIVDPGPVVSVSTSLQMRNMWMMDHCDRVLALFDGSRSGTWNCIEYADKAGKPVSNLWASWLLLRALKDL